MGRVICRRCFWPEALCWCGTIQPMDTETRLVFLMHPKEFKREKAGTGRLAHLCLARSEIHMGVAFDQHEPVQALLRDPTLYPVLLYPGRQARNLGDQPFQPAEFAGRRLTVLVLDGTWSGARKMLKLSPSLQQLPRIMFTPSAPSRYVIKQQPQAGCLSTLEAAHELLTVLARTGVDRYPLPQQMLDLFRRMQDFQIQCAGDPLRSGYRRSAYRAPADRRAPTGRRRRYLAAPLEPPSDSGPTATTIVSPA